ncbi:hypothetical protein HBI56_123570 [Parastagonospora nodorum]|nr:hypothetical protein HBH56_164850 [Parastagonospora nodorum]KAH3936036.1 hypothetical protein HBH54_027940 [Parastagonospora nodorum]KAH3968597.1 hypothetical protein HBH51_126630 [Parastagonospora nodorum]KAH4076701.1 hypothetical protein HBH50_009250 [Parastagonospora nodorum]KAH4109955.1 hypothetical protein HBH46_019510 [Parastagonospora nodorum]
MEKPTAVPHATGSRIAAAGFAKRKLGRVKEGRLIGAAAATATSPPFTISHLHCASLAGETLQHILLP